LPPKPGKIGYDVHASYRTCKIQIPRDVNPGDVVAVNNDHPGMALVHSTGYTDRHLDRDQPFIARIRIISMTQDKLTARVEMDLIEVNRRNDRPREQWSPMPIQYRGTETFVLRSDYVEGWARRLRRLEAEVEAKRIEVPSSTRDSD